MVVYGTRQEVWAGEADKTRGGLSKEDLMLNKRNKLVSKKRSALAQNNVERLREYQYKKRDGKSVARSRQRVSKKASQAKLQSGTKTG